MSDDSTLSMLLEWYVNEVNISRRIGWKHGDAPAVIMNVARFFNDVVGDFPQHRCERWFDRGLRCPFGILEEAGFMIRTGDPPDELPNEPVRSPKGGPKIVTPARNQQVDVMVQAEALVASAAESVPVRAGRSL